MLTIKDFNTPTYFGYGGNMPGGYGRYMPVKPHRDWHQRTSTLMESYGLSGSVLELGCAMGSWVRAMRDLGLDAYGMDLDWPIRVGLSVWPELRPYLIVDNVVEACYEDWDFIVSWNLLECLSDEDLKVLAEKLKRFKQIHIVDPRTDGQFYNKKTMAQWQKLGLGVVLNGC